MDLHEAMEELEKECQELERALSQPEIAADGNRFRELAKRYAEIEPTVALYQQYQEALRDSAEAESLLQESKDPEMREFLEQELTTARERAAALERQIMLSLLPQDPLEEKNALLEIRAGTGGEEAALFAADLLDMYTRLAERRGWQVEILDESRAELGGLREAVIKVIGPGAYGDLQMESGVHRVQRVPETESQGRIHTSAASVAVFPEIEEEDFHIDPADLSIEVFRAGGPGGQHMQKNETAVRVTHKPTGISVTCSSERSQLQNKERALTLLRARLYQKRREEQEREQAALRRQQIKSGDRSEKIRTYNFPQDRLTDHRIGLTLHNLPALLGGELDELIAALREYRQRERLAEMVAERA